VGPIFTSSYGEVGGFCWIVNTSTTNIVWRYVQIYLWMFVTVIYCCYVWFSISQKMQIAEAGSQERERRAIVSKTIWYPLVLIITRFPGLVERVLDMLHLQFFWLSVIHTTLSASNGWLNALVYGFTPVIRLRIKQECAQHCSPFTSDTVATIINSDDSTYSELAGETLVQTAHSPDGDDEAIDSVPREEEKEDP